MGHMAFYRRSSGQNLVELVMVLPLLIVFIMSVMEFGRAWQVFHTTKLAAIDGAHTASITRNAGKGQTQCMDRLQKAGFPGISCVPSEVGGGQSYQMVASSEFVPLFAGLNLCYIGCQTPLTLIPATIPVSYTEQTYSTYL